MNPHRRRRRFWERLFPGSTTPEVAPELEEEDKHKDERLGERLAKLHEQQAQVLREAATLRGDPRLRALAKQAEREAKIHRDMGLESEEYQLLIEDQER